MGPLSYITVTSTDFLLCRGFLSSIGFDIALGDTIVKGDTIDSGEVGLNLENRLVRLLSEAVVGFGL